MSKVSLRALPASCHQGRTFQSASDGGCCLHEERTTLIVLKYPKIFFRDVLNTPVSRGYLRKVIEKVSNSLEAPDIELLNRLPLESKVNVDETGHKENKERFWTWVFKTDLYVLFKIEKSRGSKVLIDVLGKEFNGVSGSDYFSAYRKYMKDFDVTVQFCLAHLIRGIRFHTTLPDEETKCYGEKLLETVKTMFGVIHDRDQYSDEETFGQELKDAKQHILSAALNAPSKINEEGKEKSCSKYGEPVSKTWSGLF